MKDFELPSNIKQIGTIGDGPRVYIEDTAYAFLNRYAAQNLDKERIALLAGKHIIIDSVDYIFIYGAIKGVNCEFIDGIETFGKKSFYSAGQYISKYFKGYEITGWMQSQPGYGTYLNPFYAEYHMNTFAKRFDLMYVVDPVEKASAFYHWNDNLTEIVECTGFFVFYERNPGMNEYMAENKSTELAREEAEGLSPPDGRRVKDVTTIKIDEKEQEAFQKHQSEKRSRESGGGGNPARRSYVEKSQRYQRDEPRQPPRDQRMSNMLVAFSCILFVICFMTGVGLIQSQDRISKLEENITVMSTAYNYLSGQINQLSAQAVFAPASTESADPLGEPADSTDTQTPETAASAPIAAVTPAPTPNPTPTPTPTPIPTPTPTPPPVTQSGEDASYGEIPELANAGIPETYIVQEGDNLLYISNRFYGTPDMVGAIMELNGMSNPDMVFYGQVLNLPPVPERQ